MSGKDRPPLRTAVLVSGRGSNLQAIIDKTRAGQINIALAGVISDRPGVFALERARDAGIPALTVDHGTALDRETFAQQLGQELERLRPDLVVLAGFMRILPADLVNRYRGCMLNVHPSLLPRYTGLHTYRRVLAAGDGWHGSTVHFVIPELDSGPAIIQYRVKIKPGETEKSLRERVQRGEHIIYPQALQWIADGRVEHRDGLVLMDGRPLRQPVAIDEAAPP